MQALYHDTYGQIRYVLGMEASVMNCFAEINNVMRSHLNGTVSCSGD